MNPAEVLETINQQLRRHPAVDSAGTVVERDARIVRSVSAGDGWNGVTWSDLDGTDDTDVDLVIRTQIERFAATGRYWEWKHYSYDRPADLPARLLAAGFVAEPAEALLVAEIADLAMDVAPPAGVSLRPVTDAGGIAAMVAVHDSAFGGDHSHIGRGFAAALARRSDSVAAVVAMDGETPISSGRLEFHHDTEFASLWGGGTVESWRGRGVFRSLVAYRARLAADRGFRYLQVDASPDSRPILKRLGFVELAMTTPFVHPGS